MTQTTGAPYGAENSSFQDNKLRQPVDTTCNTSTYPKLFQRSFRSPSRHDLDHQGRRQRTHPFQFVVINDLTTAIHALGFYVHHRDQGSDHRCRVNCCLYLEACRHDLTTRSGGAWHGACCFSFSSSHQ